MRTRLLALTTVLLLLGSACQATFEVTEAPGDPAGDTAAAATAAPSDPGPTPEPTATPVIGVDPTPTPLPTPVPQRFVPVDDWLCTRDVKPFEELNLRIGPSLDAPILFGIPGGSCRMTADGTSAPGWHQVTYETQTTRVSGWVSTEFATVSQVEPGPLATHWFATHLNGDDTSDLIYEPWLAETLAENEIPATAFRPIVFDDGNLAIDDCRFVSDLQIACGYHIVDDAGALLATAVVTVSGVGFDGFDPSRWPADFGDGPRVTGWYRCDGVAAAEWPCDSFAFDRHDRIVVDDTPDLAGVPIGTEAEQAIALLVETFGVPTDDTGWVVGCPLDGDDINERYLDWGTLQAGFRSDDRGDEFLYWSYWLNDDRTAEPDGPQPGEVMLPGRTSIGLNIGVAADQLAAELFFNDLLQLQQTGTDAWTLYGSGPETDSRINGVGVPWIPICD